MLTSRAADELRRALADPLRSRIVVKLLADEQLCTCHIVQTNVFNHLRVLRRTQVVETEQAGRYTYYRLRPKP